MGPVVTALVGDLVGALVGPLVGPLVVPLVDPLVGEVRFRLLCVSPILEGVGQYGQKQGDGVACLDGQIANRQSLAFSERGQLSQAILQFHVERALNE